MPVGRKETEPAARPARSGKTVPAIIFHGDRDTTVHPDNGAQAVERAFGTTRTRRRCIAGRYPAGHGRARTTRVDGEREILEHWNIHGAGHAWSGRIRRGRTQRRKCCVSFSRIRTRSRTRFFVVRL
jgi:hypothetical protein